MFEVVGQRMKQGMKTVRRWLRGDDDLVELRAKFVEERALLSPHVVSTFGVWRAIDGVVQVVASFFVVLMAALLSNKIGAPFAACWLYVLVVPLGVARVAQRVEKRRLRSALSRLALPPSSLRALGAGSSVAVGSSLSAGSPANTDAAS